MNRTNIKYEKEIDLNSLLDLYNSVGWSNYTNDASKGKLEEAIRNSTFVVSAWVKNNLVGIARCISDDVSICYLQDILINPNFQKQGIGRKLLTICLERFKDVKTKILLTDDEEKQRLFYESFGYKNTRNLKRVTLNTFVMMNDIELN